MPNGVEKNFSRLCFAIDGFRERFGRWPLRVVVERAYIEEIRDSILAPGEFDRVLEKVDVVEGDARFRAEDDEGNVYDYGEEGPPAGSPRESAQEWLGASLRHDLRR